MNEEQIKALKDLTNWAEEFNGNSETLNETITRMLFLILRTGDDKNYDGPAWKRGEMAFTLELVKEMVEVCNKYVNAYSSNIGKGMEITTVVKHIDALRESFNDLRAYR